MEDVTAKSRDEEMVKEYAARYLTQLNETINEISLHDLEHVVQAIDEAYQNDKAIFIIGNGGSASTASHFACDLGKGTVVSGRARFRVTSLNDNVALMTAIGNDLGFDHLFSEQLKNVLQKDDVVILISGSGDSPNLLKAAQYATARGAVSIGLLGSGGGKLKDLVNKAIILSSTRYELVEPVHLILEHVIAFYFKEKLAIARAGGVGVGR